MSVTLVNLPPNGIHFKEAVINLETMIARVSGEFTRNEMISHRYLEITRSF